MHVGGSAGGVTAADILLVCVVDVTDHRPRGQ